MIDKREVELYQSIKAPDGLKERTLTYNKTRKRILSPRYATAVAASFLLIAGLSASIVLRPVSQGILIDGHLVERESVTIYDESTKSQKSRMQYGHEISFHITGTDYATISVSDGILFISNEDVLSQNEDTYLLEDGKATVSKNAQINWSFGETKQTFLTVTTKKVVMLMMVSTDLKDYVTSKDMVEAFKKVCGGTLSFEL